MSTVDDGGVVATGTVFREHKKPEEAGKACKKSKQGREGRKQEEIWERLAREWKDGGRRILLDKAITQTLLI